MLVVLVALSVAFLPAIAAACAVCVGSSPADHAYFWAVLLLMLMPFTVTGSIGGLIFYVYRHPRSRSVAATSSSKRARLDRDDETSLPVHAMDEMTPLVAGQKERAN
jgi:hypothetical protein